MKELKRDGSQAVLWSLESAPLLLLREPRILRTAP